jgi:hypothetical protein
MTIAGHDSSYEALIKIYKETGTLDDFQIEWLLEHYGMAARALKRIKGEVMWSFDDEDKNDPT